MQNIWQTDFQSSPNDYSQNARERPHTSQCGHIRADTHIHARTHARTHGRARVSEQTSKSDWESDGAGVMSSMGDTYLHLATVICDAKRFENECIENRQLEFLLSTHTRTRHIEGTLCTHCTHCVDFVYISGVELCKQSSHSLHHPALAHRRANSREWVCFTNVQIDIHTHSVIRERRKKMDCKDHT